MAALKQLLREHGAVPRQFKQAKSDLTLTYVAYMPHVMAITGRDPMGAGG
jgi:hypothetical protein